MKFPYFGEKTPMDSFGAGVPVFCAAFHVFSHSGFEWINSMNALPVGVRLFLSESPNMSSLFSIQE